MWSPSLTPRLNLKKNALKLSNVPERAVFLRQVTFCSLMRSLYSRVDVAPNLRYFASNVHPSFLLQPRAVAGGSRALQNDLISDLAATFPLALASSSLRLPTSLQRNVPHAGGTAKLRGVPFQTEQLQFAWFR